MPNTQSSFFKTCESLNIPYCTGPSGTMGYLLASIPFLLNLKREELEELILIHAAILVGMGHHSFYECIIVAKQMGLFAKMVYADKSISVSYKHEPNDPIYAFIPPAIRDLTEFQNLLHEFQDFRPRI